MTFTFNFDATDDGDLVRYHLSDTDEDTAVFSDEQITMALSVAGGVNQAVISLIKFRLQKLANEPDAKVDFVSVDWKRSQKAWEKMLSEKRKEFGISSRTARAVQVYRKDSLLNDVTDWDALNDALDDDC